MNKIYIHYLHVHSDSLILTMDRLRTSGMFILRSKCRKIFSLEYSTNAGLLSDVNVLDLTRVVAGPYCTMMLGDLGANVIKVESLDGDEARKWGPPFVKDSRESYYFMSVNRNKKSVCVNLKSLDGKSLKLLFACHMVVGSIPAVDQMFI